MHDDDEWEWGAACDGCYPASPILEASEFGQKAKSLRFNVKQLGDKHTTVAEMNRETYARARADGRDITRV